MPEYSAPQEATSQADPATQTEAAVTPPPIVAVEPEGLDEIPEASITSGTDQKRVTPSSGSIEKEQVTERDIFMFARWILGVASGIYLVVAILYVSFNCNKPEAIKDIWDFSKVAVTNIITLVIGFYFGTRKS